MLQWLNKKEQCLKPYVYNSPLNKIQYCQNVYEKSERNWKLAQKQFQKGNIQKGKKIMLHILRILNISCHYLKNPVFIPNLECVSSSSKVYSKIMNDANVDWVHYDNIYTPIYDTLRLSLKNSWKIPQLKN